MFHCPRCKAELPVDAKFCTRCGFRPEQAQMQAAPTSRPKSQFTPLPLRPNSPTPQQRQMPLPAVGQGPQKLGPGAPPPTVLQGGQGANGAGGSGTPKVQDSGVRPVRTNTPPRQDEYGPVPIRTSAKLRAQHLQKAAPHMVPSAQPPVPSPMPGATNQPGPRLNLQLPQPPARPQPPQPGGAPPGAWSAQGQVLQAGNAPLPATPGPTAVVAPVMSPPPGAMPVYPNAPVASPPAWAYPTTPASVESITVTKREAEHWRQSWLERQKSEAGPASNVTRGQAAVPEPLLAIEQSVARMRAQHASSGIGRMNVRLLLPVVILGGLILIVSIFILSTFFPDAGSSPQTGSSQQKPEPQLSVKGTRSTTVTAGGSLTVHGTYFGSDDTVTFLLDSSPLAIRARTNGVGAFDAQITIPATQLAGTHALEAQDTHTKQHAFLAIQVAPTATTDTTALTLSLQGQRPPITQITFRAIVGQGDPGRQTLTLSNTSDMPLHWTAESLTDDGSNWLLIDDQRTSGTLDAKGTDQIGISIDAAGLTSSPTRPYRGSVLFTVEGQGQVVAPVQLYVQKTALEVVVNPNPVIAVLQPGGACLPTTLTIINLSDLPVGWRAEVAPGDQEHLRLNNQPVQQGTLAPASRTGDTMALRLSCSGAQIGEALYTIRVSYNGNTINVPVSIRYSL